MGKNSKIIKKIVRLEENNRNKYKKKMEKWGNSKIVKIVEIGNKQVE